MNQWNDPINSLSEESNLKSQLEKSQQILKAISDSTQSAIFIIDPDHQIIFFNKKAKDSSKLLCGRDLHVGDNILKFRLDHHEEEIFEVLKGNIMQALAGSDIIHERELHHANERMWIQSEYTPVYDQQKVVGVMLRVKEISERKGYEQKIEKQNEQLKQIAWTQSHKTRQPVATILGLINILDKTSLTEENKMIIEMLEKTVDQLEEVIRVTVNQANLYGEGVE